MAPCNKLSTVVVSAQAVAPGCALTQSVHRQQASILSTVAVAARAAGARARLVHAGHDAGEAGIEVHADPGVIGRAVVLKVVPGARVLRPKPRPG